MTDYDDQMERQDEVWLDEVRDKQHLDRMWERIKREWKKAKEQTEYE